MGKEVIYRSSLKTPKINILTSTEYSYILSYCTYST